EPTATDRFQLPNETGTSRTVRHFLRMVSHARRSKSPRSRPAIAQPRARRPSPRPQAPRREARAARRKFLSFFPGAFNDETYVDTERSYKWQAHLRWQEQLSETSLRQLIEGHQFAEIAKRATSIESRTNLLFSFEKMALRDA